MHPGLGFIHTGKQLSFVYDVADLYKADVAIPVAFATVKSNQLPGELESQVRRHMRHELSRKKLLKRIPEDLDWIFQINTNQDNETEEVGDLWDRDRNISGGINWAEEGDDYD